MVLIPLKCFCFLQLTLSLLYFVINHTSPVLPHNHKFIKNTTQTFVLADIF